MAEYRIVNEMKTISMPTYGFSNATVKESVLAEKLVPLIPALLCPRVLPQGEKYRKFL